MHTKVRYEVATLAGFQQWEADFEWMNPMSTAFVLDHAERTVKMFAGVSWFQELRVWDLEDQELLAVIKFKEPTVEITVHATDL